MPYRWGLLFKRLIFPCYISILKDYFCSGLDYLFLIISLYMDVVRLLAKFEIRIKRKVFKKIKMFSI
ncbi:hypothetical protein ABH17_028790 (plasmid) [Bacillus toyonensis]|nr:hypothetical protein CH334_13585 [Lysinibacillus sp. VIA-II-2016]KAB2357176.1 hypothetical protein F8503_23150 [Bacillus toyonensis]OKO50598.1 hypothetical protein ABH17_028790 [Bacillus toyonensis]PEF96435.1 hypothetical protein COO01_24025 [Bacillus toyonensis]PEM61196.1 hypothetical protein CN625_15485 [Bacillus toyonensis]